MLGPYVKNVSDVLEIQPRLFVPQANALVTRRNNIHIVSPKDLAEVLGLIGSGLWLKWERMVVDNYAAIERQHS